MHPMWDSNHKLSSTSTLKGKRGDKSRTCLLDSIPERITTMEYNTARTW